MRSWLSTTTAGTTPHCSTPGGSLPHLGSWTYRSVRGLEVVAVMAGSDGYRTMLPVAKMTEKVRVGIVGCGVISGIYLKNLPAFELVEVVACADLLLERAQARASEYGIKKACTPDELYADPDVELVVNLTIPKAHAGVALAAVEAGKSVYTEKPLTVERSEGKRLLELAREKGVLVGGAPDTFLGGGH